MDPTNSPSTSLAAASAAALQDFNAPDATPTEPVAQGQEASIADAPSAREPVATPAAELEYEVTVSGQKYKVPVSELAKGYQRDVDYRQKTMTLADERRMIQAERARYEAEKQQIAAWLQDPNQIRDYYLQLAQSQGMPVNPQDIPNLEQVDNLVRQRIAQVEKAAAMRIAGSEAKIQTEMEKQEYFKEIDKTLGAVVEEFPRLQDIDDVKELLASRVLRQRPASLEEAKVMLKAVAKEQHAKLEKTEREREKMAAVRQAKLTKQGIEPPGGKAPAPTPGKSFKLGSAELRAAAIADLEAAGEG